MKKQIHFPKLRPRVPWDELSIEERKKETRRMEIYAAMIDRVDQNLGSVLDHLKAKGKFENTLVLFLSDNGADAQQPTKFKGDTSGEMGASIVSRRSGRRGRMFPIRPSVFKSRIPMKAASTRR